MSVITIYGMPQSRAARVLWMARELGVEHVNDPVHFQKTKEPRRWRMPIRTSGFRP